MSSLDSQPTKNPPARFTESVPAARFLFQRSGFVVSLAGGLKIFLRSAVLLLFVLFAASAFATSNYEYQPGEYVTITDGVSPDGRYAIATHGEGDLGYDNWHVYLMNAQTGKKIGPLEEIIDPLDTAADAYVAQWSPDSTMVAITYRADRRVQVKIVYRIANRRAYLISGPS